VLGAELLSCPVRDDGYLADRRVGASDSLLSHLLCLSEVLGQLGLVALAACFVEAKFADLSCRIAVVDLTSRLLNFH